ncbi:E3 ubiquitin-protein ligase RING1-like [Carica papaya]|uniref:E3 ubiquitin-protein ligase RING1-like n=1 Tax=Carica papaya TaxID=3649 RepID=UPI000B8CDE3C|nr:E3 ubiquitin-protein ligase RING1-like [Carica papaya]
MAAMMLPTTQSLPPPPPPPPPPLQQLPYLIFIVVCSILLLLACLTRFRFKVLCFRRDTEDRNLSGERQTQTSGSQFGRSFASGEADFAGSLLTVYRSGEGKNEGNFSDDCVICMESFAEGDECRVIIRCNHGYHKSCLDQWLIRHEHCPICRGSV